MTTARLRTTTDSGVVRAVLVGEIDLSNADAVGADLRRAITNQITGVSIDLTDVGYLDSAGLRVLFLLVDRLATLQIAVELVTPPGSPSRRVVEVSGLATLVPLDPPDEGTRAAT